MTDGFLAFPLKFPGTAVWRAMKGRQYVIKVRKGPRVTCGVSRYTGRLAGAGGSGGGVGGDA
jgi:hypothetical protein